MSSHRSIKHTFLTYMAFIVILVTTLNVYLWMSGIYYNFRLETERIRDNQIRIQKAVIENEVSNTVPYIRHEIKQFENQLKQDIRQRTYEAWMIAGNLYQTYHGVKDDDDIREMIGNALRNVRVKGSRGYYFIGGINGEMHFNSNLPELEGKNALSVVDSKGNEIVREFITIIREKNEGFFRYYFKKPEDITATEYEKISFVKRFEPYDWYIGTGCYFDNETEMLQKKILEYIESIRFGDNGYLFAFDRNGVVLSGALKGDGLISDSNPRKASIVSELIHIAESNGGFFQYNLHRESDDGGKETIVFVDYIDEWDWYVCAGFVNDQLDKMIEDQYSGYISRVTKGVVRLMVVLIIGCVLILIAIRYLSGKINTSFDVFSSFFEQASLTPRSIDVTQFAFPEFKRLAMSVNRMIETRIELESKQKQAEEKLVAKDMRFQSITSVLPSGIFQTDTKGYITYQNKRILEIIGTSPGEGDPEMLDFYLHPDDRDSVQNDWKHAVRNRESFTKEFRLMCRGNTVLWVLCMAVPEYDADNGFQGFVGTITEITELKKTTEELAGYKDHLEEIVRQRTEELETINQELVIAKDSAEMAVKAKNEFLSNMGHEIRTPINAIIGMGDLMLTTPLTKVQKDYLDTARSASESLSELIDNILDIALFESGKAVLQKEEFSLSDCLDEIAGLAMHKISEKGLEFVIDVDPEVPDRIIFDKARLVQVIMNFISNAEKFTESGEIVLSIQWLPLKVPARLDRMVLQFSIRDTGTGIDYSQLPGKNPQSLFEAFSQADGSITRRFGGTGLGLSINRKIVEQAGGTIRVDSEVGKGSVFSFVLTLRYSDDPSDGVPGFPEAVKGYRVLIAETNRSAYRSLQRALESYGMSVFIASEPGRLEETYRESSEYRDLDLMILSRDFPGVFQFIDSLYEKKQHVMPMVVISGSGLSVEEEARLNERTIFLMKPLHKNKLYTFLYTYLFQGPDSHPDDLRQKIADKNCEFNTEAVERLIIRLGKQLENQALDADVTLNELCRFLPDTVTGITELIHQVEQYEYARALETLETISRRLFG